MNTINSSIQINFWKTTHYLDESQGEETGRYEAFMATTTICIVMPMFQTCSMFVMTSHGITSTTATKKWMFAHTSGLLWERSICNIHCYFHFLCF